MIVDVHTHLAYKNIFSNNFLLGIVQTMFTEDEVRNKFVEQLVVNSLKDDDGAAFVLKMDEAGIARSVLLIADFGYALGEAALSIEEIHLLHHKVLQLFPSRFQVFAGVDPRRGEPGVRLFEKAIREYGFHGLKLYPPCGFELDHPGLYPYYELCSTLGVPVLSHTGPSLARLTTEKNYPATILKVSEQFPNVRFILGHGGGRDWETSVEVALRRPNVSFEISSFHVAAEMEELKKRFRYFFDRCPDQVLFGSDFPMFAMSCSQKQLVDIIYELDSISAAEKDKLLAGNSRYILKQ